MSGVHFNILVAATMSLSFSIHVSSQNHDMSCQSLAINTIRFSWVLLVVRCEGKCFMAGRQARLQVIWWIQFLKSEAKSFSKE